MSYITGFYSNNFILLNITKKNNAMKNQEKNQKDVERNQNDPKTERWDRPGQDPKKDRDYEPDKDPNLNPKA